MPVRIPNLVSRELLRKDSDLDKMVTIAANAVDLKQFGADSTLKITRHLLHQACSSYAPCDYDKLICHSGQRDGKPIQQECLHCRVSDFSASGFYSGEIVPVQALIMSTAMALA